MSKDIDFEQRCCNNCRFGFITDCERLKAIDDFAQFCTDEVTSAAESLELWGKRYNFKQQHCCNDFKNRWLEYPIAIKEVECKKIEYNNSWRGNIGSLVKVRPCSKKYEGKTYLGFLLGELPLSITQSHNKETHVLTISTHDNLAIFVPQLKKIIFGCESWWSEIKSEAELKEITDDDIKNVWYVKILQDNVN